MSDQSAFQLKPESFLLLVRQLKTIAKNEPVVEVDLDVMKVKGDLRVIRMAFPEKILIARSSSLDLLKRAATAGWPTLKFPKDLEMDVEFTSLVKNKGTELLKL